MNLIIGTINTTIVWGVNFSPFADTKSFDIQDKKITG
jgi:hypothetical protein